MLISNSVEFAKQFGLDIKPNTVCGLADLKNRKTTKFKRAHSKKNAADINSAEKWLADISLMTDSPRDRCLVSRDL